MERFSLSDISKKNCADVYRLVYQTKRVSKQQIATALQMSLPTVTQHLSTLLESGLVRKQGQISSGIGRKAAAFAPCLSARVSIGVEILPAEVLILLVNLDGTALFTQKIPLSFTEGSAYWDALGEAVMGARRSSGIPEENVLGVGVAIQGLVSKDGRRVTYGEILQCTGLTIEALEKVLPFPCRFFHDTECAAELEIWLRPELTDAIYLFLGHHLGGAVILDRRIYSGRTGRSGNLEHITLIEGGRPCYCGRNGCLDAYCSADALLDGDTPEVFFAALRQGDPGYCGRWTEFLNWLARSLNDLHMLMDCPIVLGGYLAPYLTEEDLDRLFALIQLRTAFKEDENFLCIGVQEDNVVAAGAALPYIRDYLDAL